MNKANSEDDNRSNWEVRQGAALDKAFDDTDAQGDANYGEDFDRISAATSENQDLLDAMQERLDELTEQLKKKQKDIDKMRKLADQERRKAEQEHQLTEEQRRRLTAMQQEKDELDRKMRQERLEMERVKREKEDAERRAEEQLREVQKKLREAQQEKYDTQSTLDELNRKFNALKNEYQDAMRKQDEIKRLSNDLEEKARRARGAYDQAKKEQDELLSRDRSDSVQFQQQLRLKEIEVQRLQLENDHAKANLQMVRNAAEENAKTLEKIRNREQDIFVERQQKEAEFLNRIEKERAIKAQLLTRDHQRRMELAQRETCRVDANGDRHCNVSRTCNLL